MNFSSPVFLFAFLPVAAAAYHLARPARAKNVLLIAAGLVFYAFGDLRHLPLLLASCVLHYFAGRWLLERTRGRRAVLWGCIALDIGVLCAYKLSGALPLGISFYTFQAISYIADAWRAPEKGTRSFRQVLQYLTFFPQLVSGPLMKFSDARPYLDERAVTWDDAAQGICRFVRGLAKKLLLSAAAAELAASVYAQSTLDALCAWTGAVCYCIQLYFDFSGYSDMAIGLGLLFGVPLPENFNHPYCASSLSDFWRRWHMSLSGWFRDYIYIPLGGSRKGTLRTMCNKLIVFLATGIWHGTGLTFLLWGVWNGLWSCVETAFRLPKKLEKKWYGHIWTLLIVIFGFALFRADSLAQGFAFWRAMLSGFAPDGACRAALLQALSRRTALLCACGVVLCTPAAAQLDARLGGLACADVLRCALTLILFILCVMALAASSFQPFIYASF